MGAMDAEPWVHCNRIVNAAEAADNARTVAWLRGLPRKELAATRCEHLQWYTVRGAPKVQACGALLERLQAAGLLELPAAVETPLCVPLAALGPV